MSENAILVTILGSALTLVLGIATFFIQKWIALVDETLKEHNSVIYKISSQVSSLESVQSSSAEDIAEAVRTEGRASRAATSGLPEIKQEIERMKDALQTRVLPQIDTVKTQLGKIIVLEKNQDEHGKLITKLYDALKVVIEKSSRPK